MTSWRQIAELQGLLKREAGTIHKDWGGKVPIALLYPNTYHVGMSSLALQALYGLFNAQADLVAERVFWAPRTQGEPLSTESQRPLSDFAIVACSMSFELDYFHFAALLRQADIPLLAEAREESDPIVLMGGPAVTGNPAPLAPLVDAFVIGEVEPIFDDLVATLQARIETDRNGTLDALSEIPGVYVPSHPRLPVCRQWLRDLDAFPTHSVVLTPKTEFGDMYLIEIARGCRRGCRFCLAGYVYRPMRERSLPNILEQAREGLAFRKKVGLVSAAVSDYSQRDALVTSLRDMGTQISVSSLRADSLSPVLLQALADSGTRTLTIAPEAGSQRLRNAINKGVTEEHILEAAALARQFRFRELKLYFMIGLPGEEEEDVRQLSDLTLAAAHRFEGRVAVNVSPFVPKAHTPFERSPMASAGVLQARLAAIEANLKPRGVEVRSESIAWARVQGVLARGGPELAPVIADSRSASLRSWRAALESHRLAEDTYAGPQPKSRVLPWQGLIATGVSDSYLARELRAAEQSRTTAACPESDCTRCGVC